MLSKVVLAVFGVLLLGLGASAIWLALADPAPALGLLRGTTEAMIGAALLLNAVRPPRG